MNISDQLDQLQGAHQGYTASVSPHYDEVLRTVADRADHARVIGKAEIGALVLWKRLSASTRWAAALMNAPDSEVRGATNAALEAARDESQTRPDAAGAARRALSPLPGFKTGDALASAVICALAPDRMAVYDRRAQAGLERLEIELTPAPGRYGSYMKLVENLVTESANAGTPLTAREVDTALYWLGG